MAHADPQHGHHAPHAPTHDAVAVDPEHDIDAKSATLWVVGGALGVFFCLWIMVPIFMRVLEAERIRKIDNAPAVELNEAKAKEQKFLNGENPTKKNLQQVVEQLRRK
jgi:beta-lactamase regulating signal transducer with metallopeptidase domain